MQEIKADLLKNAVLFALTLRKWGNRRKGDMKLVTVDGDKKRMSLSKQLIDSKEFNRIVAFQQDVYLWAMARCVPSFVKEGFYLVNVSEVGAYETKLNESRNEMRILVDELVAAYPVRINEARDALNGMFRDSDYPKPEVLATKFDISWNWFSFGIPEMLPDDVRKTEAAKIEKSFDEAKGLICEALRDGFSGVLEQILLKLSVNDGKPKIFRDSLFEDLTTFVSTFDSRNLVQDGKLAEMVKQANSILAQVRGNDVGSKAQVIRDSEQVREQTAKAFGQLKASVESLVVDKPSRRFDLED